MAVNAEFNRVHPRHKENGRFREKSGSDATAYAERISAKIAKSRGESDSGGTKRPAAKKAAPRKATPAKKAPAKKATPAKKAPAAKRTAPPTPDVAPHSEIARAHRYFDAVEHGASRDEIDKVMHDKLKHYSVPELRSLRKALVKDGKSGRSGSIYSPTIADSIARLLTKKESQMTDEEFRADGYVKKD